MSETVTEFLCRKRTNILLFSPDSDRLSLTSMFSMRQLYFFSFQRITMANVYYSSTRTFSYFSSICFSVVACLLRRLLSVPLPLSIYTKKKRKEKFARRIISNVSQSYFFLHTRSHSLIGFLPRPQRERHKPVSGDYVEREERVQRALAH